MAQASDAADAGTREVPGGATSEPAGEARARRPWHRRRAVLAAVAVVVVLAAFFGITGVTGLPGPGPLRRFPYADLSALADGVNEQAGELRTADDCWRQLHGNDGPQRSIAAVDHVRSRVVVRAYAAESGVIDPATFEAVVEGIDQVIAADPRFSWSMIVIEPSPDGWSPLVSCRLVTRGWIGRGG